MGFLQISSQCDVASSMQMKFTAKLMFKTCYPARFSDATIAEHPKHAESVLCSVGLFLIMAITSVIWQELNSFDHWQSSL